MVCYSPFCFVRTRVDINSAGVRLEPTESPASAIPSTPELRQTPLNDASTKQRFDDTIDEISRLDAKIRDVEGLFAVVQSAKLEFRFPPQSSSALPSDLSLDASNPLNSSALHFETELVYVREVWSTISADEFPDLKMLYDGLGTALSELEADWKGAKNSKWKDVAASTATVTSETFINNGQRAPSSVSSALT